MQSLIEAGVPLAPAYPRVQAVAPARMAASVRCVMQHASALRPVDSEALAAFLKAWSQHWPTSFREHLGADGEAWLEALVPRVDPGRLIRLKRIAVAHLSARL